MKYEEIIKVIEDLAKHQGFYGRLLRKIRDLEENDEELFEAFKKDLEDIGFKDPVGIILYFEL